MHLWRLCDQPPQPAPRAVQVEDAQRKAADDRQRREKERCGGLCSAARTRSALPSYVLSATPMMPCRTSDQIEAVPAAPPNKHAVMVRTAPPQESLSRCCNLIEMTQLPPLQGIRLVVD